MATVMIQIDRNSIVVFTHRVKALSCLDNSPHVSSDSNTLRQRLLRYSQNCPESLTVAHADWCAGGNIAAPPIRVRRVV